MNNNNTSNNKLVTLPISKRIDFIYNFIMEFGTNFNNLDWSFIFNILSNCDCCLRHNTNKPTIFQNNLCRTKQIYPRLLDCPCPCRFISRILFKKMVLVNVSPSLPFYNKEIIIDNSPSTTIPFDIFINIMKMRSDLIKIDMDIEEQRKLKANVLNEINNFTGLYKSINNKYNIVANFISYIRHIKNGYSSDQIFELDILYNPSTNSDSDDDLYHDEESYFDDYYPDDYYDYPDYPDDDYPDDYYDDYDDNDERSVDTVDTEERYAQAKYNFQHLDD